MNTLILIYSVCFGFGISFLAIQLFFAMGEHSDCSDGDHQDISHVQPSNDADPDQSDVSHNLSSSQEMSHFLHHPSHNGEDLKASELHSDTATHNQDNFAASSFFMTFLSFLKLTRKLTYFCAGFGSMGVYCTFTKIPSFIAFIYSVVIGTLAVLITNYLFRMISNLGGEGKDSRTDTKKLVGCFGEVITKVGDEENLGEIKITLDRKIITLYALSKDSKKEFQKGDVVIVYNINEKGYAVIEEANEKEFKSSVLNDKANKEEQEDK